MIREMFRKMKQSMSLRAKPRLSLRAKPRLSGRSVAIFALASLFIIGGIITTLLLTSLRPARAVGITKYAINAGGNWSANDTQIKYI